MLTRQCPECAAMLTYRTMDAFMRASQRQSKCRTCAAKIDPRQPVVEDRTATGNPLDGFWRLLETQNSASQAA